ncbi:hypothetical protein RIF29_29822 [Crotalaria pallida]|uniref:Uncharacterized protein n=1 Tax=Crotalaria pallida TaxID=3830 RepID=A0AAN9EF85_CROPI
MNYIQPGPGNEHSGHNEKRNSSHSHHDSCPVHPRNRRQHQHSPPQNYSPPSKHSGVNVNVGLINSFLLTFSPLISLTALTFSNHHRSLTSHSH